MKLPEDQDEDYSQKAGRYYSQFWNYITIMLFLVAIVFMFILTLTMNMRVFLV